jgi:hypothetical protein
MNPEEQKKVVADLEYHVTTGLGYVKSFYPNA